MAGGQVGNAEGDQGSEMAQMKILYRMSRMSMMGWHSAVSLWMTCSIVHIQMQKDNKMTVISINSIYTRYGD
jgi:hypothetical protein